MFREEDRVAIATFLNPLWVPDYGPLAWPNARFKIPKNGRWGSVDIIDYDTSRASLSDTFQLRHLGAVQLDFYTPEGQGSSENKIAADELSLSFLEVILPAPNGALQFGIPKGRPPSANELRAMNLEDNWNRYTLTIPYKKDSLVVK